MYSKRSELVVAYIESCHKTFVMVTWSQTRNESKEQTENWSLKFKVNVLFNCLSGLKHSVLSHTSATTPEHGSQEIKVNHCQCDVFASGLSIHTVPEQA